MGRTQKLAALASIVSIGGSLAACGSHATLSRAALIAKADAICASAQKSASAVTAPANLLSISVAAQYFDKIAPITGKETSQLQALSPAGSVASEWKAFIAAQKAANQLVQNVKHAADTKNATGLQSLRGVTALGDRVLSTASKLGAETCAQ